MKKVLTAYMHPIYQIKAHENLYQMHKNDLVWINKNV